VSRYKNVDQNPDFIKMEKDILEFWYKDGIVNEYLHKNDKSEKRFSFLDGPITANNPMGIHHAWGRTLKDIWQKFYNLKGYKQRFQNGFDNQGLWVEVGVEKEKGFKTKKDIENYGIEKFVQDCKDTTYKWSLVQTEQSKRLGYFMNWENSYYTMSEENNYMIWTFLKRCYEKGYVYKGHDVLPWCPRCGTAISQHEILTSDYQDLKDQAVYFKLKLKNKENEYLLVWTTTPWTLVANVAVAVGENVQYVKVKQGKEYLYVAKARIEGALKGEYEIMSEMLGNELLGLKYEPLFKSDEIPALANYKPSYEVVSGGMLIPISEEEGTGMVHVAPGCGAEDYMLGKELKLESIAPLDESGIYIENYGFLTGKYAHEVNQEVFDNLEKKGFLYRYEEYTHRYPMCWRCATKLVFRLVDEWYISMNELRYDMMEVTKQIRWMPEFGLDRELDWLKNMHDWCISKKRYWGLALPIWTCDKCGNFEVIGDEKELENKAVEGWDEFKGHTPHKPFIDEVKIKCSKCGEIMTRIPDVGNPWLDAGIVPYSTIKYREDKKYWEKWFPVDFVTECFPGQFKNWFYALIAMSTVLENKPPFKNLLGHALVKDEKGEEMHKSKGNYIAFDEGADKVGADILRWIFVKQNPTIDLLFGYNIANDVKRNFYLMVWNIYKYFITYAQLSDFDPKKGEIDYQNIEIMDKWVLSRLNTMIKVVDDSMVDFNNAGATKKIEEFIEELSTWYIRRSRDRFAALDKNAINVLWYVLKNVTIILSIYMPYIAEEMYQNLCVVSGYENPKKSVALEDYPVYEEGVVDNELEKQMLDVKVLANVGQSIRTENALKIRQPLAKMEITGVTLDKNMLEILKSELNIKDADIVKTLEEKEGWIKKEENGFGISINVQLSEELKEEGTLREVVRSIQNERKKKGLKIGDKIKLVVLGEKEVMDIVKKNEKSIASQVYADKIVYNDEGDKDSLVVNV